MSEAHKKALEKKKGKHKHTYKNGKCTQCGYEKEEEAEDSKTHEYDEKEEHEKE